MMKLFQQLCIISSKKKSKVDDLSNSWVEEADDRLVLHVEWAIRKEKCERVVVISNNSDTVALLLYHLPHLRTISLKELWQQYGTGEKRRMIPLRQALLNLGQSFTSVILKAHVLTGDDCISKIGTKHAALSLADRFVIIIIIIGLGFKAAFCEGSLASSRLVLIALGSSMGSGESDNPLVPVFFVCFYYIMKEN